MLWFSNNITKLPQLTVSYVPGMILRTLHALLQLIVNPVGIYPVGITPSLEMRTLTLRGQTGQSQSKEVAEWAWIIQKH